MIIGVWRQSVSNVCIGVTRGSSGGIVVLEMDATYSTAVLLILQEHKRRI